MFPDVFCSHPSSCEISFSFPLPMGLGSTTQQGIPGAPVGVLTCGSGSSLELCCHPGWLPGHVACVTVDYSALTRAHA